LASKLLETPKSSSSTFLGFPLELELDNLNADIAILGIPFGLPYIPHEMSNDQSHAPDAIRQNAQDAAWEEPRTRFHYDWDLGGELLDGRNVKVVDYGNVTAQTDSHEEHYRKAEIVAKKILASGSTLITLGGDHGVSIPVMRAMERDEKITLVHVDAHLDWRDEINGVKEGYSSPMRRASEMRWFDRIVQIGMRGVGSARSKEVEDARKYGAEIITAYELHEIGMQAALDRIPNNANYYLSIDADGLDPTIMPAVTAPTPGGLNWVQIYTLIHGLVNKGRVLGMDLVEISPSLDNGNMTLVHAERIICNFIGATVRANYFE